MAARKRAKYLRTTADSPESIAVDSRRENELRRIAPTRRPLSGDQVQLTPLFLRMAYGGVDNSMMYSGPPETWTVLECCCGLCSTGRFVAIDAPALSPDGSRMHVSVAAVRLLHNGSTTPLACEPCHQSVAGHPIDLRQPDVLARFEGRVRCDTCEHRDLRRHLEGEYARMLMRRRALTDALLRGLKDGHDAGGDG
jgi:hypothetical protein